MLLAGIYKILNLVTGKIYIGSTINLNKRLIQHRSNLNTNRHTNILLQNSYNLHGSEAFSFEIIEYCDKQNLIEREQFWMDFHKSYDKYLGYNLRPRADTNFGRKHSQDEIKKRKLAIASLNYKHSEQSKLRMSQAKKGLSKSEDHKLKLAAANLGKIPKHRNFEKWPCPKAAKCRCDKCKQTKNMDIQRWRWSKQQKERKVYEIFRSGT